MHYSLYKTLPANAAINYRSVFLHGISFDILIELFCFKK